MHDIDWLTNLVPRAFSAFKMAGGETLDKAVFVSIEQRLQMEENKQSAKQSLRITSDNVISPCHVTVYPTIIEVFWQPWPGFSSPVPPISKRGGHWGRRCWRTGRLSINDGDSSLTARLIDWLIDRMSTLFSNVAKEYCNIITPYFTKCNIFLLQVVLWGPTEWWDVA